jgi:hypothetical protein
MADERNSFVTPSYQSGYMVSGLRPQMPTNTYSERFANAAVTLPADKRNPSALGQFGSRLFEEFGLRDIWDEFARFDDNGMSVSNWLSNAMGLVNQTLNMPLQAAVAGAQEINRFGGAWEMTVDRATGHGAYEGRPDAYTWSGDAFRNYLTGGMTPEEQERLYSESAPGVHYNALTLGDYAVVNYDRMIKAGDPGWLATLRTLGVHSGDAGPLTNGSYIPRAWDMMAPDAGQQLDRAGIYESQRAMSNLTMELILDPLNWLATPIGGAVAARKGFKIVSDGLDAGMLGRTIGTGHDYTGSLEISKLTRRMMNRPAGMGLWNQGRMLDALHDPNNRLVNYLLDTRDPNKTAAQMIEWKMFNDADEAFNFAKLALAARDRNDVIHMINAATMRDVDSIRVIDDLATSGSQTIRDNFMSSLGLQDDMFTSAALDFAEGGQVVPKGHILADNAKQFVDEVLDDNPAAKAAWEALDEAGQTSLLNDVTPQMDTMKAVNRLFGEQRAIDPATGQRIIPEGVGRSIEFIPRDRIVRKATDDPGWITQRIRTIVPENVKRLSRNAGSVILMDKPGLVFTLHGPDATTRFNQIIEWTDQRIHGPIAGRRAAARSVSRFRVGEDAELTELHGRWMQAALDSSKPMELRADMVNQLQNLVLRRMAEANGIDPEFANVIVGYGMDRARKMAEALADADRGYTAAVVEDGRANIYQSKAMVERQTANFIPLMDWDAAFKAMSAIGKKGTAITNPTTIISKAEAVKYLPEDGKTPLKYVGREDNVARRASHTMIDVADAVNHIFKTSVLLRLGYPFRNLAEGTASAIAGGTSTAELVRNMDLAGFISYRVNNIKMLPTRTIDRVLTTAGWRLNDDALLMMGIAHGEVNNLVQDRIQALYAVIGGEDTERQLASIITDLNSDPALRQEAIEGLRWIQEQKNHLSLGIAEDNRIGQRTAGGMARPIHSQDAAQHLYHADTVGDMEAGKIWESEGTLSMTQSIDRPIRLVDNPNVAHGNVNLQWDQVPTAGPKVADRADALRKEASKAGGGSLFRYTDRTGKQRQTRNAQTVLNRADPAQPITVHRAQWVNGRPQKVGPGKSVTLPPPSIIAATKGLKKTHHLQMRDNPTAFWRPFDSRQLTPTTEVRALSKADHPNGFPKAVSVDTWGREIDLRSTRIRQQLIDERAYEIDEPLLTAAINGDHAAQDKVMEALANPLDPSKDKIVRAVFPDSRTNGWGRHQIIVHPDGVGNRGYRAAVEDNVNRFIEQAARARTSEAELDVARSARGTHVRNIGGRTRRERRELNRLAASEIPTDIKTRQRFLHGLVGEPLVPNAPLDAVRVLRDGGFQQLVDQMTDAAVAARRNQYTMHALYQQRKANVAKMAKMRGIRNTANLFRYHSIYGVDQTQPSLLSGDNGAMFGMLASADATHSMGFSQMGYYTDWMRDAEKAALQPTTIMPEDPRYWDGLANLFNRQYRDAAGFNSAREITGTDWYDNLDPMVQRLLEPGDRERIVEDAIDWALHTSEGRQWMRTIGLKAVPPRSVAGEVEAAEAASRTRAARDLQPPPRTRAERRMPVESSFTIEATEANVGDVIGTMSNFLTNYVMHDARAVDALVDGRNLTGSALREMWESNPWELKPISGLLSPTTAESRALLRRQRQNMAAMEEVNHRIVSGMGAALRRIGSIPETRLLRHPVFEAVGQADLRQRMIFAERQLGRTLNVEEINQLRTKSQQFALKKMEQTLYTLTGRSRADDWLRFVAPFLPAHRNAVTRWGRIALSEPGRIMRLASHVQSAGQPLHIVTQDGEAVDFGDAPISDSYILLPGVGGLVEKFLDRPGAAEAMKNTYIPVRSLDLLFQGDIASPGFGPWVTAPLQVVLSGHPEWMEGIVGDLIDSRVFPVGPVDTGNRQWDFVSAFLPTGVRRLFDRWFKQEAWAGEFDRSLRLLLSQQQSGEEPPMTATELFEKAERLTNTKMTIKVLSSVASPVATQQRGEVEQMAQVWRSLRDAYGSTEKADEVFTQLFPDEYLLTLSSSRNLTGSAATSRAVAQSRETGRLQQYAAQMDSQDLLGFFDNYDDVAFSMNEASEGYTTEDYNPWARLYQRHHSPEGSNDPYREKYTPEESLRNAKVKDGWRVFDQSRAAIQMELSQRGLAPGTYAYQKELDGRMAIVNDMIGQSNPEWADEYGKRDENKLLRNEMFFKAAISDESLGFINDERRTHPLIISMNHYFQVRDALKQELMRRYLAGETSVTNTYTGDNQDLAYRLAVERERLAIGSPAFRQWADRYFRNDMVSINDADIINATREAA